MNRIITISREFGSGGRELGRRIAEELGIEYYDREIIEQIARHTSFSEEYVHQVVEGRYHRLFPITVNHSFFVGDYQTKLLQSVFQAQKKTLQELAELSDCVIVGRCADYLLRDYHPYRIFVYADFDVRKERCMAYNNENERFSEQEIEKHIRRIDRERARFYREYTGQNWGDKAYYDLCVNTTSRNVDDLISPLAKMLEKL